MRLNGDKAAADPDDGDAGHATGTYICGGGTLPLPLGAVNDPSTRDWLVGLGDRPPGEPNEGAPPTSSVWVDTYEDGHPNDRVVFVDLDVVETLYGSLKNSIRSV